MDGTIIHLFNLESPSVISVSSRVAQRSGPDGLPEYSLPNAPYLDPRDLLENTWKTARQMEASTLCPFPTPHQSPPGPISINLVRLTNADFPSLCHHLPRSTIDTSWVAIEVVLLSGDASDVDPCISHKMFVREYALRSTQCTGWCAH